MIRVPLLNEVKTLLNLGVPPVPIPEGDVLGVDLGTRRQELYREQVRRSGRGRSGPGRGHSSRVANVRRIQRVMASVAKVTLRTLTHGENMPLAPDTTRLQALVTWQEDDVRVDMDAAALLLGSDRRVLSDEDFVFYNQPDSPDAAVRHQGRTATESGSEERVAIDLDALRPEVTTIALTASVYLGTFGQVQGLTLLVLDGQGEPVTQFQIDTATSERALLVAEVYRHDGGWKLRAVGQGWESGLAGLVAEFGVSVDIDDMDSDFDADTAGTVEPAEGDDAQGTNAPTTESAGPTSLDSDEEAAGEELVEIVEHEGAPLAEVIDLDDRRATQPAPDAPSGTPEATAATRRRAGVRTRKAPQRAAMPGPALQLAGDEAWQPARVFSIYGVGAAEEQEKRASSALLSMMMGVRPFGRALASRFGAPAGTIETYLEVPFRLGESTVYPDGVIRVARAGRTWTGLLETKTGSGQLRRDQVEHYLDVAKDQGFDAVITLSNEIAPAAGEHPVAVDKRKLRKVALHHVSWAEILHEAKMTLAYRGVADPVQAWLLAELLRYLTHPRSGASGFDDMGPAWVTVREAIAAGTLRVSDRKVPAVADAWTRLVRHLTLSFSADLGVTVSHVLPRRLAADAAARVQAVVTSLVSTGTLDATLRVPGAAGPLTAVADIRTSQVRVSVHVPAPQEGTGARRLAWLMKQLKEAPDDLLVEVIFAGRADTTCERLKDVRDDATRLLTDRSAEIAAFRLTRTTPMGTKRSGVRGAFVPSITAAAETFYAEVVQPLRPWTPPAPRMSPAATEAAEEAQRSATTPEPNVDSA